MYTDPYEKCSIFQKVVAKFTNPISNIPDNFEVKLNHLFQKKKDLQDTSLTMFSVVSKQIGHSVH